MPPPINLFVSGYAYDWLGRGAYFWEDSPKRAMDWANFVKAHPQNFSHKIKNPFVIGAVIELGNVLDLTDAGSLEIVRLAYQEYEETCLDTGYKLSKNESSHPGDADLTKRFLDCAVINFLHDLRHKVQLPLFDSVRGVFTEPLGIRKRCRDPFGGLMARHHTPGGIFLIPSNSLH